MPDSMSLRKKMVYKGKKKTPMPKMKMAKGKKMKGVC
jgi:hypothetical protein